MKTGGRGRGGGCGRGGGRGRGRGDGRGRGRGVANKGLVHGRDGKVYFNNVDVTNPGRNYTPKEKQKLDQQAWAYIRNRMPGGRHYEGPGDGYAGRGGGGRYGDHGRGRGRGRGRDNDRTVNAVDRHGEYGDDGEEDDGIPRQQPVGPRGPQNGLRFGRGAHRE